MQPDLVKTYSETLSRASSIASHKNWAGASSSAEATSDEEGRQRTMTSEELVDETATGQNGEKKDLGKTSSTKPLLDDAETGESSYEGERGVTLDAGLLMKVK